MADPTNLPSPNQGQPTPDLDAQIAENIMRSMMGAQNPFASHSISEKKEPAQNTIEKESYSRERDDAIENTLKTHTTLLTDIKGILTSIDKSIIDFIKWEKTREKIQEDFSVIHDIDFEEKKKQKSYIKEDGEQEETRGPSFMDAAAGGGIIGIVTWITTKILGAIEFITKTIIENIGPIFNTVKSFMADVILPITTRLSPILGIIGGQAFSQKLAEDQWQEKRKEILTNRESRPYHEMEGHPEADLSKIYPHFTEQDKKNRANDATNQQTIEFEGHEYSFSYDQPETATDQNPNTSKDVALSPQQSTAGTAAERITKRNTVLDKPIPNSSGYVPYATPTEQSTAGTSTKGQKISFNSQQSTGGWVGMSDAQLSYANSDRIGAPPNPQISYAPLQDFEEPTSPDVIEIKELKIERLEIAELKIQNQDKSSNIFTSIADKASQLFSGATEGVKNLFSGERGDKITPSGVEGSPSKVDPTGNIGLKLAAFTSTLEASGPQNQSDVLQSMINRAGQNYSKLGSGLFEQVTAKGQYSPIDAALGRKTGDPNANKAYGSLGLTEEKLTEVLSKPNGLIELQQIMGSGSAASAQKLIEDVTKNGELSKASKELIGGRTDFRGYAGKGPEVYRGKGGNYFRLRGSAISPTDISELGIKPEVSTMEATREQKTNFERFGTEAFGDWSKNQIERFNKMNPEFAGRVANLSEAYYKDTGKKVNIDPSEMYRTYEEQVQTKRKYGGRAATPGKSSHGFGFATDIPKELVSWAAVKDEQGQTRLEKAGLHAVTPEENGKIEPWHVTPSEISLAEMNKMQAQFAGESGSYTGAEIQQKYGFELKPIAKDQPQETRIAADKKPSNFISSDWVQETPRERTIELDTPKSPKVDTISNNIGEILNQGSASISDGERALAVSKSANQQPPVTITQRSGPQQAPQQQETRAGNIGCVGIGVRNEESSLLASTYASIVPVYLKA